MPTNDDLQYRIAESQGNWTDLTTGQDTVSTSGTAVQLNGGTSLTVPDGASLTLRAIGGTGEVFVGDSTVDSATGYVIGQGETASLNITDVATVYIDAANAGDGVSWVIETDA